MPPARYYSSTAVSTTLLTAISTNATQLQVASNVGFPTNFPFTLIVEKDSANEEIVTVTGVTGTSYDVTRGVDGTSPRAHTNGVSVEHGVSALDYTDFRTHESGLAGVHGLGQYEEVVGTITTQTVSNKTLGSALSAGNFKITNLADPTVSNDASNKKYVDDNINISTANRDAAATSATNASTAQTAAETAQAAAELALDQFTDIYLGAFASDPTLDNDGNALAAGALYFSTNANLMRVYTAANGWQYVAADTSSFVEKNEFTAKGDLLVGDGSASLAAVNVGNDGQALLADSTTSSGVAWTNFGPTFFGFVIEADGTMKVTVDQTQSGGPYSVENYNEWTILSDAMAITINASGELVLS